MSDYASTDTKLVDSGDEERGRRLRKPISKGKAYNEQRKHRTCINVQTKITKHVNKINLVLVATTIAILLSKSWIYLSL